LCAMGNLETLLAHPPTHPQSPNDAQRIQLAHQIASGLAYLHDEAKIAHRDVKTANVLIGDNFVAKLGDFGLAHKAEGPEGKIRLAAGVPRDTAIGEHAYLAPELHQGYSTIKADIYAFGVVLLEILSGMSASEAQSLQRDLFTEHVDGTVWRDEDAIHQLSSLAHDCLEYEPPLRPRARKAQAVLLEMLQKKAKESPGVISAPWWNEVTVA